MSIAIAIQRVHIELQRVKKSLRELRLSQHATLNPQGET